MRFTFDGWETGQGSYLSATGVGFRYHYIKEKNILRILGRYDGKLYQEFTLRKKCRENPLMFVNHIEKLSQIKALTLSSNQTTNLMGTLQSWRVEPILSHIVRLARYSFWLDQDKFNCFSKGIVTHYFLKDFRINKLEKISDPTDLIYQAEVRTLNGYSAKASASNLPHVMANIAHTTIRDLVVREYHLGKNSNAQELMTLATQLGFISKTLDRTFIPRQRIVPKNPFKTLFNGEIVD